MVLLYLWYRQRAVCTVRPRRNRRTSWENCDENFLTLKRRSTRWLASYRQTWVNVTFRLPVAIKHAWRILTTCYCFALKSLAFRNSCAGLLNWRHGVIRVRLERIYHCPMAGRVELFSLRRANWCKWLIIINRTRQQLANLPVDSSGTL